MGVGDSGEHNQSNAAAAVAVVMRWRQRWAGSIGRRRLRRSAFSGLPHRLGAAAEVESAGDAGVVLQHLKATIRMRRSRRCRAFEPGGFHCRWV